MAKRYRAPAQRAESGGTRTRPTQLLVDRVEAAEMLGCCVKTIIRHEKTGRLKRAKNHQRYAQYRTADVVKLAGGPAWVFGGGAA